MEGTLCSAAEVTVHDLHKIRPSNISSWKVEEEGLMLFCCCLFSEIIFHCNFGASPGTNSCLL